MCGAAQLALHFTVLPCGGTCSGCSSGLGVTRGRTQTAAYMRWTCETPTDAHPPMQGGPPPTRLLASDLSLCARQVCAPSRVAMLYERYLGINGSLFELKVLVLQFATVLLQVGAEGV